MTQKFTNAVAINKYSPFHQRVTHPAYSLEVIAIPIKVDKLPVECPGERHIQSRVVGNLAGKYDALANNDLHVAWPQRDPGGFCSKSQNILASEDRLLCTSDSAPGNCPSVPSTLSRRVQRERERHAVVSMALFQPQATQCEAVLSGRRHGNKTHYMFQSVVIAGLTLAGLGQRCSMWDTRNPT